MRFTAGAWSWTGSRPMKPEVVVKVQNGPKYLAARRNANIVRYFDVSRLLY